MESRTANPIQLHIEVGLGAGSNPDTFGYRECLYTHSDDPYNKTNLSAAIKVRNLWKSFRILRGRIICTDCGHPLPHPVMFGVGLRGFLLWQGRLGIDSKRYTQMLTSRFNIKLIDDFFFAKTVPSKTFKR